MKKIVLDDIRQIKKLDARNMRGSLELLGEQMKETLKLAKKLKIPPSYKKINKILVLGMGGSEINFHALKALLAGELKAPLEIVSDYHLPGWVDKNTLAVGSSYSGNTEEVLRAVAEAGAKGAKLLVLTSGGELKLLAKKYKAPALIFTGKNNPCGQPRIGIGYMVMGGLMLLNKAGVLTVDEEKISGLIKTAGAYGKKFSPAALQQHNRAKQIANKTIGRSVWYVASEHLAGNAHVGANQMNENAKRFAGYFFIPELNHHLLEGLTHPSSNQSDLLFILLESKLYDERNKARYEITRKILDKNKIRYVRYVCREADKLTQAGEILALTGWTGFYAAVLEKIDPSAIPYVDYFKQQLKKVADK